MEEILVHERLGDLLRWKFTYLGKKKGANAKCDVKFKHFESMTKQRSSEILGDEKTFWRKSHMEKCNFRNLS